MAIRRVDVDAGRVPPVPPSGQLAPLVGHYGVRVRKAFAGDDIAAVCPTSREKSESSRED
jgi:hypothetical protein